MRHWFWLIALLLPALAACNQDCKLRVNGICYDKQRSSDPPLTAKWQIFDADSGKPLEGVWVNFLWYGTTDSRGYRRCVGAVLGRTDANGRFEATAKNGSWRFGGQPPMLFKRDYEPLWFHQNDPEGNQVTAYVAIQLHEREAYPAWFERLEQLGYAYNGTTGTTTYYEKNYSTEHIKDSMNQLADEQGGRKELWGTRRSLPAYVAARGIGAQCKYDGADNVGFDDRTLAVLGYERAMHAYTYLCDAQWDTIPSGYARTASRRFVHQALWLLDDDKNSYERAMKIIPDYLGGSYKQPDSEDRALRPDERAAICGWLAPHAKPKIHEGL